jgi:hypothetical protein
VNGGSVSPPAGEGTRQSKRCYPGAAIGRNSPGRTPYDRAAHWKAFSPDSRTDQHPRPGAAGDGHARHGSPQRRIRRARLCGDGGRAARLPNQTAGHDLSVVRDRRLGSRDRQYAAARRQGADARDRPVFSAVARHRREIQARRRFPSPATGGAGPIWSRSRQSLRPTAPTASRR